jgi:uncharacterized protein YjdB
MTFTVDSRVSTWVGQRPGLRNARSYIVRLAAAGALIGACGPVSTATTGGGSDVPVASVAMSLSATTLSVGQTAQATAVTKDSSGNGLTGRVVIWQSTSAAVATVSASGLVTALSTGSSRIRATSEGKSDSTTITVTAASPVPVATVTVTLGASSLSVGQGTQATATLKDATGATLTGRTVTWS